MDDAEQTQRPRTKIAVVLRTGLQPWQELNVTAFLVSGIAASQPESVGMPYEDASGNEYLPMFGQPVMVFSAGPEKMTTILDRLESRSIRPSIYTEELFATGNDIDNRAAVKVVDREDLELVGLAFRTERSTADKVLKGLSLHS